MSRATPEPLAKRYMRLKSRLPGAFLPALSFLILLGMGIVMLLPGTYYDGAAGQVVCAIGGVGLAVSIWSMVRYAQERDRNRRRRGRG